MGEGHVGLLVAQVEEHLDQHLLGDVEDIQQGVHHGHLEGLLVEIQVGVDHHLEGEVQDLDIQDKHLVEEVLWVELEAWILVASHWGCWAWNQECLACLLPFV